MLNCSHCTCQLASLVKDLSKTEPLFNYCPLDINNVLVQLGSVEIETVAHLWQCVCVRQSRLSSVVSFCPQECCWRDVVDWYFPRNAAAHDSHSSSLSVL